MTGEWEIIDFGELHDYNRYKYSPKNKFSSNISLQQRAKKLAREMAQTLQKLPDYTSNLRVLESNVKKSKKSIVDMENMIEFTLKKRPLATDWNRRTSFRLDKRNYINDIFAKLPANWLNQESLFCQYFKIRKYFRFGLWFVAFRIDLNYKPLVLHLNAFI